MSDSVFDRIRVKLKDFPQFIKEYFFGFFEVSIGEDVVMTSLGLGCIGLSFLKRPLVGIVTYLLSFVALKSVNSVANAIGSGGANIANAIVSKNQPPNV